MLSVLAFVGNKSLSSSVLGEAHCGFVVAEDIHGSLEIDDNGAICEAEEKETTTGDEILS